MIDVKGRRPIELSKVGDPLVNLLFSLALSKACNRPLGRKVSNKILSEALARADLREQAGSRMTSGDLGDFAEGFIFKAWAEGKITMEVAVDVLSQSLSPNAKGIERHEEATSAFENLLRLIAKR
jgi:hypothetical protein